jgi:hypothetical protein
VDAFEDKLGRYESIKARFQTECPKPLDDAKEPPTTIISSTGRSCIRPVGPRSHGVRKGVYIGHLPATSRYYGALDSPITAVAVAYYGSLRARPVGCDSVVEEAVGYMRELLDLSEVEARSLTALVRQEREAGDAWRRTSAMERELCFIYWEGSPGGDVYTCDVEFKTCDLVVGMERPIVAAGPWPTVSLTLDAGASDGASR